MTEPGARPAVTLSAERRALLDRWRKARELPSHSDAAGEPIARRPAGAAAPLSYAQERLWFLEQLDPGRPLYNIPVVLRLSVALDAAAVERSLAEIVRRHEILRSRFVAVDGLPRQVVDPPAAVRCRTLDLSDQPAAAREAGVHEQAAREGARPFDLAAEPPFRAVLLKLAERDHALVCTFHHIACDGWSVGVFTRELGEVYAGLLEDRPAPLPDLPVQYGDYAAWQRRLLAHPERRRALLDYWRRQLAGAVVPEIAPDRPRPARPSYRAGRQALVLAAPAVSGLRMLCHREGVTPFMVLAAALAVLIQRTTARDDVPLGTSVAGRTAAELDPLIGCFLNTLVLRTDLSGDPRVGELLQRVRETALGAYAHQALPFELLLEELQPVRDLSRTPLFQVYLNYLNVGELDPAGAGTDVRLPVLAERAAADPARGEPLAGDDTHAPFDLALYARPRGDELALTLVYAHDLFEPRTASRFLRDWCALLTAMVERPEARLSTLPLADEPRAPAAGPRPAAAPGWSELGPEWCERSIGSAFAAAARRYPERSAVVGPGGARTYAALERASARLGARLHRALGAGGRVGLLCGRDAAMVEAVLGVLQSGNAYVPLDPAHPVERLAEILDDAEVAAVLADDALLARGPELAGRLGAGVRLLRLGGDEDVAPGSEVEIEVDRHAMAYLLYTSGSTGAPKGVVQLHRNVLRHIRAYVNALCIGPEDTLSLLAPFGFDAAVMDLFGALTTGARLVPLDPTDDPEALGAGLAEVTVLHATPTVYRHLLATVQRPDAFARVRLVVLGGEPVTRADFELYRRRFPAGCLFVNGFGPSESTLAVQYFADRSTAIEGALVPIGRAVADTEVRLLNAERQEVGPLAVGEIAITSEQVAAGYWRDAELTRAAFLPGPAGLDGSPARTYLTGDLGRRLRDGTLEFVGRRDAQVKVRGVRVEPAEVERHLAAHPAVAAAAVVASADPAGEPRLVAWVVPRPAATAAGVDPVELRRFLLTRLPEPMVPAAFAALDELPMTVSGKVDRRALEGRHPAPAPERTGAGPAPPRTPLEERLAALWCEVLALPAVGRDESFFELGGHSLLATQVISRIRTTLGRALPLRAFFESPTVAGLAEIVERMEPVEPQPPSGPGAPRPGALPGAARDRYKVRLS